MSLLNTYDFLVGMVSVLGLLYLLYAERDHSEYRRATLVMTFGMFTLAATEPITSASMPAVEQFDHVVCLGIIAVGVYGMVSATPSQGLGAVNCDRPNGGPPPCGVDDAA